MKKYISSFYNIFSRESNELSSENRRQNMKPNTPTSTDNNISNVNVKYYFDENELENDVFSPLSNEIENKSKINNKNKNKKKNKYKNKDKNRKDYSNNQEKSILFQEREILKLLLEGSINTPNQIKIKNEKPIYLKRPEVNNIIYKKSKSVPEEAQIDINYNTIPNIEDTNIDKQLTITFPAYINNINQYKNPNLNQTDYDAYIEPLLRDNIDNLDITNINLQIKENKKVSSNIVSINTQTHKDMTEETNNNNNNQETERNFFQKLLKKKEGDLLSEDEKLILTIKNKYKKLAKYIKYIIPNANISRDLISEEVKSLMI